MIRNATKSDFEAILGMMGELFKFCEKYGFRDDPRAKTDACFSSQEFGMPFLVATDGEIPVGFLSYTPHQDESIAMENDIFVVAEYRGKGYSKAMRDEGEKQLRAKGVKTILAVSFVGNDASKRALKNYGFRPVQMIYRKEIT